MRTQAGGIGGSRTREIQVHRFISFADSVVNNRNQNCLGDHAVAKGQHYGRKPIIKTGFGCAIAGIEGDGGGTIRLAHPNDVDDCVSTIFSHKIGR